MLKRVEIRGIRKLESSAVWKKKIKQKISTVVLTMILFLRTLPMKATECNFSVEILIAQIAVDVV